MTPLIPDQIMALADLFDFLGVDGSIVRDLWVTEAPKLLAIAIPAASGARDEAEYYYGGAA